MTKKLLIKYLAGHTSQAEDAQVHKWVSESKENEKYFIDLKDLYILQNMPDTPASEEQMEKLRLIKTYRPAHNFRFKTLLPYAAIILILISISLNIFQLRDNHKSGSMQNDDRHYLSGIVKELRHTMYTNKGVKALVTLPDGSIAWLNSDSKIIFPDKFSGPTREVELSGEAFFDVIKDSTKPMMISVGKDITVKVTGTQFNIRAYKDESEIQTTLIKGTISLLSKSKTSGKQTITKLSPNESFILKDNYEPVLVKQVDTNIQLAWKHGQIIFNDTPLPEVIKKLERWHGTQFIVKDKMILDYKFTANIRSESIVQIMEILKYCSLIDYSVENNIVTLSRR